MAINLQARTFPYIASGDLSSHQYKIVTATADDREIALANATSEQFAGILMNAPDADQKAATVCDDGVCKCIRGAGTITAGVWLKSDANGLAIPVTASDGDTVATIGRCYATFGASNSGETISVKVMLGTSVVGAAIT